jgi:hypothetical protein
VTAAAGVDRRSHESVSTSLIGPPSAAYRRTSRRRSVFPIVIARKQIGERRSRCDHRALRSPRRSRSPRRTAPATSARA